jgi:hypothetical protein
MFHGEPSTHTQQNFLLQSLELSNKCVAKGKNAGGIKEG